MDKNNSTYKLIIFEFGSISHAGRKLGLTRKSIYDFIEAGKISARAKNKIMASGYDPVTFKLVNHGEK